MNSEVEMKDLKNVIILVSIILGICLVLSSFLIYSGMRAMGGSTSSAISAITEVVKNNKIRITAELVGNDRQPIGFNHSGIVKINFHESPY